MVPEQSALSRSFFPASQLWGCAMSEKMLPTLKSFTAITESDTFLRRYRRDEKSVPRQRKLPFNSVLTIPLPKSVKSLQRVLNEWCRQADEFISASALT